MIGPGRLGSTFIPG